MLNKFKEFWKAYDYWRAYCDLKNCHSSFPSLIFEKPFLFLFLDPCCLVLGPNFWPISCPFLEFDNSFLFIFSPDYV